MVWIICIYHIVSIVIPVVSLWAIKNGKIPLNAKDQFFYDSIGFLDFAQMFIGSALAIVVSVQFIRMKKKVVRLAFYDLVYTVFSQFMFLLFSPNYRAIVNNNQGVKIIVGFGFLYLIYRYAKNLDAKGMLES